MPAPTKIDLDELNDLLARGKTLTWLAKHFNVSIPAVHQAKNKLKKGVCRAAVVRSHQIVNRQIHAVDRIQRIEDGLDEDMGRLLDLFEESVTIGEKAGIIKLRGEILDRHRKLLLTKLEYLRGLSDLQVVPEFVEQVLTILEEVEHGSREKILRRLTKVLGPAIAIITGSEAAVPRTFSNEGSSDPPGGCAPGDERGDGDSGVQDDPPGD